MIKDIFDAIYCVNLDRREDRWDLFLNEVSPYDFDVERISAVDGNDLRDLYEGDAAEEINFGHMGCSMSHRNLLLQAIEMEYDQIFVLEDDAVLAQNFEETFQHYYEQLPEDWQFCYLGGNDKKEAIHVGGNIYKSTCTLTTHAYIIKVNFAQTIIDKLEDNEFKNPVDNQYVELQQEHDFYVFKPHIVLQRANHSDIVDGFRDYSSVLDDRDDYADLR